MSFFTRRAAIVRSLCIFTLLAGGCTRPHRVPITHWMTDTSAEARTAATGRQYYVILHVEGRSFLTTLLDRTLFKSKSIPLTEVKSVMDAMNKQWSSSGAQMAAYRLAKDPAISDPFLTDINASHVVILHLDVISVHEEKSVTDQTQYRMTLPYQLRVYSYPDRKLLLEKKSSIEMSGFSNDFISDTERAQFGQTLAGIIHPVKSQTSKRILLQNPSNPASSEAYRLAVSGTWDKAEALWFKEAQAASPAWRDVYDLGVAAEYRGDVPAARQHYEQAKTLSRGDPKANDAEWAALFDELKRIPTPIVANPNIPWFTLPVAVMPFANESNSLEGPVMIRKLVWQALKDGGYQVQPLEETDEMLRAHGFTDGGQLTQADAAQLAEWLKVDLLFYGTIEKFDRIPLGIAYSRTVAGTLRIWDRELKTDVWSASEPVHSDGVLNHVKPAEIALALVVQLTYAAIEQILRRPLGAESVAFVDANLGTLPMKAR